MNSDLIAGRPRAHPSARGVMAARPGRLALALLCAALASLTPASTVFAQEAGLGDDGEDEEPSQPVLVPPELETPSEPDISDEALEALAPDEERLVVLVVTIAADGTVSEATMQQGAGEPFDAAAIEAAQRLVFRPATRDGEPVPARVRYRYRFRRPEPPPPPPPARLIVRVVGAEEAPVEAATVRLIPRESAQSSVLRESTTDDLGRVDFSELIPGAYTLEIEAEGFPTYRSEEDFSVGERLALEVELSPEPEEEEEEEASEDEPPVLGVTAQLEREYREPTRRTISQDFLTNMPGTRGDALRVVELLPGVGRPTFGTGALYIRGAAPQDSEVFVNGASVPLLYHFGGLTSFYNSRLLERIDFYPSNFSVRFGRRIGGILEVEPRDPTNDDFHGIVDVNLIDASLLLEARLGDNASIALAARRSYVDLWLAEVIPEDSVSNFAAPVYYDYQLIFNWRPEPEDRIQVLVYGSSDEFASQFGGTDEGERPFGLGLSTQFHRGQVSWRHRYDDNLRHDIMFAGGWTGLVIQAGETFGFDADFVPLTLRAEWNLRLHERVQVRWGLDWLWTPTELAFRGGVPGQTEGAPPKHRSERAQQPGGRRRRGLPTRRLPGILVASRRPAPARDRAARRLLPRHQRLDVRPPRQRPHHDRSAVDAQGGGRPLQPAARVPGERARPRQPGPRSDPVGPRERGRRAQGRPHLAVLARGLLQTHLRPRRRHRERDRALLRQ